MVTESEHRVRTKAGTGGARAVGRGRRFAGCSVDARAIALGLKSGLIATVVMTVFRMPISESLPPTAEFWARYVGGGEPEDYPLIGLALHLAYGAAAGGLFAAILGAPAGRREVERERVGVVLGVVYGVLLSFFGERVLLRWLLGLDPEPDERFVFHVSHVVYGLTLGAWMGSRSD